MSRPFAARYPGTCPSCGDRFGVDEPVRYIDDELLHDDCADHADDLTLRAERAELSVCPSCWTVHRGECL